MNAIDRPDVLARFWSKVNKAGPVHATLGTPCWLWVGRIGDGYGKFSVDGVDRRAHRVSFMSSGLSIPTGLELDHLCRVRSCVNPAHLEPVTRRENIARSPLTLNTIQRSRTHCPQGHPYEGSNLRVRRGKRTCRECDRVRHRERYASTRASVYP